MYRAGMTLKEYIRSHPRTYRGTVRARLARALGVSVQCIAHYEIGLRRIPSHRMAALGRACEGRVSLEEMLPQEVPE